MRSLFSFCYRFAPLVLLLIAGLTAIAFWSAKKLTIDVSTDGLVPTNTTAWENYNEVLEKFGSDQLALVYVEDPNLFDRDRLLLLNNLVSRLRQLPEVERTESIFSVSNIRGDGGWVETGPLFERIPDQQALIDQRKEQALQNPLLLKTVISPNGNATLISLYLRPHADDDIDFDRRIYQAIESILDEHTNDFQALFQIGSPALHTWMSDFILEDQRLLLPVFGLLLVVLIAISLGSIQGALIPIINATISTLWTLGLMAWLDIPLSTLNYIIPALILIIGSTEDVHILAEYKEAHRSNLSGLDAVRFITDRIGLTLLLTGATTVLGFAVTGINALGIMQEFGASAAIGMATRFVVSVTFIPAYLRFFGNRIGKFNPTTSEHHVFENLARRLTQFVQQILLPRAHKIIFLFFLLVIPCALLIPKIKLSNDLIGFLHPDSPIVTKLDTVASQLSGGKVIYITLQGNPGDYRQAKHLENLQNLTEWLRQNPRFDTVTSLADYLALVNQAMLGDDAAVPTSDELIAQYLLFFHRSNLQPYVTGDYSTANIIIRCNINDSSELNKLVEEIRQVISNSPVFGRPNFYITGKSVLVASAVDKIITGQVISLSTMVVALLLIISILFLSLKAGIISVISNLFPVIVVFAFMALIGVPLNIGTCMIAAITIGIVVDDTLHLMVRYNQHLKTLKEEAPAITAALQDEFFPIFTTTLGLAGGFLVLGFSSFVPVMQFGLLSAIVMMVALVTDLILSPTLLSTIRLITLWDALGIKLRETLIQHSPIFAGMTKWQAKKLILLADLQSYPEGTTIIREGETGNHMFVVIDGELEVSKTIANETIHITTLKLGDLVGEVALVAETKRTADVSAKTPVKLLALDWDSLTRLHRSNPFLTSRLFLNLAHILGSRLKDSLGRIESRPPFPNKNDPQAPRSSN